MKIPRAPLAEAAFKAKLVARKSTLPILSHVKIEGRPENAWVTITASDMTSQLALDVECDVEEEFSFCVDAERFAHALEVEGEHATFKLIENAVQISVGKSKFKIPTLPASEFPMRILEGERRADVEGAWIPEVLERLSGFSGTELDVRPYCRGVALKIRDGRVSFTATDSMHMATFADAGGSGDCDVVIPARSATAAATLGCERLVIRGNFAVFYGPNVQMISSLIEGVLPDMERTIPVERFKCVVNRKALVDAVGIIGAVTDLKVKAVALASQDGSLSVGCSTADTDGSVVLDCEGDNFSMGFKSDFLIDVLGITKAEKVKIEWDERAHAILVRDGNYRALVATFRI